MRDTGIVIVISLAVSSVKNLNDTPVPNQPASRSVQNVGYIPSLPGVDIQLK